MTLRDTGSHQGHCADTPPEICISYRSAVKQHQCTAALIMARICMHLNVFQTVQCCSSKQAHIKHCVTALTPTVEICNRSLLFIQMCRSQQALCHCSCTYRVVLFIHARDEPIPRHCNTDQGKMHSKQFSATLPNRLTTSIVSLQFHLWNAFYLCCTMQQTMCGINQQTWFSKH